MRNSLMTRVAVYGMVMTATIALHGASTALAAGSHSGLEVLTPANFNTPGLVHDSWHVLGSRPTIELFINQPRTNQPAGTYDLANLPLQYRVQYGVCNNAPSAARVIGRFDQTGGVCRTSFDSNANWSVVHNQTYNNQSAIAGTNVGGYWLSEGSFNGNVNISGVSPTADKTTFQLYATWAPDAGHFSVYGEDHFLQYRRIHAVNFCININRQPVCGNGKVETGEQCDDGNLNNADACNNQCQSPKTDVTIEKSVHNQALMYKGGRAQFTISAINLTNVPAFDIVMLDAIPSGLTFDPAHSASICAQAGNNVRCTLAQLRALERRDFVIAFTIPTTYQPAVCPAFVHNIVSIATSTPETTTANNTGSVTATVTCPASCGDGKVDSGEQCDDGNSNNNDACTSQCIRTVCGDGIRQSPNGQGINEQCDDGNTNNNDSCNNSCQIVTQPSCGNGTVEAGEQCDDGNTSNGDTCSNQCVPTTCGDGIKQTPNGNGQQEQCDDGNTNNTDSCSNSCQTVTQPSCGNGTVESGEQCDDGNQNNNDACTNQCKTPTCGDGIVRTGVEQCDDGNTSNNDQCSNQCVRTSCGDGITQNPNGNGGNEQCDDGNQNNGDSCSNSCVVNDLAGCIDVTKQALDPSGNALSVVPQFTFRLDNGSQAVSNDSNGRARFNGVTPGSHTVSETLPSGWTLVSTSPSNGQVTVQTGNQCAQVMFINRQNSVSSSSSSSSSSSTPTFTLSKTDGESEVEPGDELTYVIRARNNSNQTINDVTITDELPNDLEFDDCSNDCDEDDDEIEWDNLTFGPNEERTFRIDVTVKDSADDGDEIRNEVRLRQISHNISITATDNTDIEEDDDNDDDDIEVELTKQASTSEVFPGGIIEYRVTIENTGDSDIQDLTLTDRLPSGITILDDGDADERSGNSRLEWEIDELEEGDSMTFTYTVSTDINAFPGTLLVNEVTLTDDDDDIDERASSTVYIIGDLPQTGAATRNRYGSQHLKPMTSSSDSSAAAAIAWTSIVTTLAGAGFGAYRKFYL